VFIIDIDSHRAHSRRRLDRHEQLVGELRVCAGRVAVGRAVQRLPRLPNGMASQYDARPPCNRLTIGKRHYTKPN
jgi:hypothetical protein